MLVTGEKQEDHARGSVTEGRNESLEEMVQQTICPEVAKVIARDRLLSPLTTYF